MEYPEFSKRLKQQCYDIIDVAYKARTERQRNQCKDFEMLCTDEEPDGLNGVCTISLRVSKSKIKIYKIKRASPIAILITAIHEVSHHVAYALFRAQGHSSKFYKVHLELLFAAFDMGLLSPDDVVHGATGRLLQDVVIRRDQLNTYKPNPVPYKQNMAQIFVFNAGIYSDDLKARGYQWNDVDDAWYTEHALQNIQDEERELTMLGISAENIQIIESMRAIAHLRNTTR